LVNTYKDTDPLDVKMYEETRCLRAVMERILRCMSGSEFVDYQFEKFRVNNLGDIPK